MTWTQNDIPDQNGRIAVVTGANGGLGLETARALAAKGAHVVMAARNQSKATSARDEILAEHPDASLEIVELDLGSQASIKAAAAAIANAHPEIDILVNNAGLMAMPEGRTSDGYETQFGVNHLGHWTFTALLLPALEAAGAKGDPSRIVTVSSVARFQGRPVDPENPHLRGNYDAWKAYGQAKLANYHFAIGLQQRLEQAGVPVLSLVAHPGLTNSDLQSTTVDAGGGGIVGAVSHRLAALTGMPTEKGARPQLRAATDPDAPGGGYYGPRFGTNGPAVRLPIINRRGMDEAIETLWQVSERETGVALQIGPAVSSNP